LKRSIESITKDLNQCTANHFFNFGPMPFIRFMFGYSLGLCSMGGLDRLPFFKHCLFSLLLGICFSPCSIIFLLPWLLFQ